MLLQPTRWSSHFSVLFGQRRRSENARVSRNLARNALETSRQAPVLHLDLVDIHLFMVNGADAHFVCYGQILDLRGILMEEGGGH